MGNQRYKLTTKLQQSTRYVEQDNFTYYTPPSILENEEAHKIYREHMLQTMENYEKLLELGIHKQDAANVIPLGSGTKVVLKFNLRALVHFMELRKCSRALLEIREFCRDLSAAIKDTDEEWAYLVDNYFKPKCVSLGYCNEEYCCGFRPKKSEVLGSSI